jgi:large subunit ribosomal protein L33
MAKKKGGARIIITLQCPDCRERNYTTTKNRRNDPQRLEQSKYCSRCQEHKVHREIR